MMVLVGCTPTASACRQKRGDFGTSRWGGSKVRLHQPRDWAEGGHDRFWQIVLQKSSLRGCRIKICNNRIGANGFLNQRCALTPDLESILRAWTGKIVLQHNRHFATFRCYAPIWSLLEA